MRKDDIVLKEADKGSAIIIMDKIFYIKKSEEKIIGCPTPYNEVEANFDHKLMKKWKMFIFKYTGVLHNILVTWFK